MYNFCIHGRYSRILSDLPQKVHHYLKKCLQLKSKKLLGGGRPVMGDDQKSTVKKGKIVVQM